MKRSALGMLLGVAAACGSVEEATTGSHNPTSGSDGTGASDDGMATAGSVTDPGTSAASADGGSGTTMPAVDSTGSPGTDSSGGGGTTTSAGSSGTGPTDCASIMDVDACYMNGGCEWDWGGSEMCQDAGAGGMDVNCDTIPVQFCDYVPGCHPDGATCGD